MPDIFKVTAKKKSKKKSVKKKPAKEKAESYTDKMEKMVKAETDISNYY